MQKKNLRNSGRKFSKINGICQITDTKELLKKTDQIKKNNNKKHTQAYHILTTENQRQNLKVSRGEEIYTLYTEEQ